MRRFTFLVIVSLLVHNYSLGQVSFTANDTVTPYPTPFDYGANMGYYSPWQDQQLADIARGNDALQVEGVGVNSLRPALFGWFLEQFGYNIRESAFKHYENLGIRNNTVFIGYPPEYQRDDAEYCQGHRSENYANVYEPIWDNGENGTPVNDDNFYALYVYKMANVYKGLIKVYEVWNEPDFDYVGLSSQPRGTPGNWWEFDPSPCDFAFRAPIQHYIRLLRISYEVIKSVDPDAYIATGGLGYPSFLDAIMRNTDNPNGGAVNDDYPLKGGAYFDVMSFHSYPHIDGSLRRWSNDINDFIHFRHSDAAAKGVINRKNQFEEVLLNYNYDGDTYPKKEIIITESNIPRKEFDWFIGSNEAQRNFLMKALVQCQMHNIKQFHVYQLGELATPDESTDEFQMMGLFQKLEGVSAYEQKPNSSGIAYKTTSELLDLSTFDIGRTIAMELPDDVNGAAFKKPDGEYIYVLWAKTTTDRSELAAANYTFPAAFNVEEITVREWNHSTTQDDLVIEGASVQLTGTPIFLTFTTTPPPANQPEEEDDKVFEIFPTPYIDSVSMLFRLKRESRVNLSIYDIKGSLVKQYHNGEKLGAGIYRYEFSGEDKNGIYLVQLQINKKKFTYRVVKGR